MKNFSDEQKNAIKKHYHDWVELEGKRYYVKRHMYRILLSELVAERLASLVNILVAHYEAVQIDDKTYYLSEDLERQGSCVSSANLKVINATLIEYKAKIERRYPMHSKRLFDELILVYLFDIIMANEDRNFENWGIHEIDQGPHIYILDNESILTKNPRFKISSFEMSRRTFDNGRYNKPNFNNAPVEEELTNFLKVYPSYKSIFQSMLEALSPNTFEYVLQSIETEYSRHIPNKETWIDLYKDHYDKLVRIFEKEIKISHNIQIT